MNGSAITFIIGWILNIEAALMLPSCAVALLYRERCGWAFAVTMALCLAIGVPRVMMGMKRKVFHARESLVTVSLSWVVKSPTGKVLGDVKQANDVPAGSLDEGWGGAATAVAEAAASGIFDVVKRYR